MKSHTLLALTASALALPGLAPQARADSPPANATVSFRVSSYEEDDIDKAKVLVGSTDRYDINVQQLQYVQPIAGAYSLTLNSSHETMSGASPWYAINQPSGDAKIVMSGATIREERNDLTGTLRRYLDNGTLGFTLGGSTEDDYDSLSIGFDAERHFNDNLTTVAGGVSLSSDDLEPTDSLKFNRIREASKNSRSVFAAVSQVIDQNTVVQTGLSFTNLSGYLTDPYKLGDRRPDSRSQIAWTTALRKFIPAANAALHADYRFYHDNFGINSHTLDLAWYQNIGDNFQLVPGIRYYGQSAARFFTPGNVFVGTTPSSSDYRLSAYGAVSASLKLLVEIDDFKVSLSAERYRSDDDLGWYEGKTSPALVSFTRLSLGVDYEF